MGVIANEVYPGGAATPPSAYQGALMIVGREANLEKRVGETGGVQIFVQLHEAVADFEGVRIRHSELKFLMEVVDRSVERLVAFQHKCGAAQDIVREPRPEARERQQPGVREEVAHPRCQQGVQRNLDELAEFTGARFLFLGMIPGVELARIGEGKR
jgi:hypothetical protein